MTWKGWENFDASARTVDPPALKPHKYHAQAVVVDGIRFASKREARRWQELKALAHAGQINSLERQVPIVLHAVGGRLVGKYLADFRYFDVERGREVVEESKGFETELWKWKYRHVEAEYGIKILVS